MEDDRNGRRPKWKTTKIEDNQNGRRSKWKMTKMKDDRNENKEELSQGIFKDRVLHIFALQDFFGTTSRYIFGGLSPSLPTCV